jgi:hypothetical protein
MAEAVGGMPGGLGQTSDHAGGEHHQEPDESAHLAPLLVEHEELTLESLTRPPQQSFHRGDSDALVFGDLPVGPVRALT